MKGEFQLAHTLYIKNEAYRFGLNAFTALRGSYAIGKYLTERLR